jgi:hypothetical protein
MKYRFKIEILEDSKSGRASRAYVGDVEVMERSLSRAAAVVLHNLKSRDIVVGICTRSCASVADIELMVARGIDSELNAAAFSLREKSDVNYECIVSLIDWTMWYCLQRPYTETPDDVERLEITESSLDDIDCILQSAVSVC